jgi:hypothetical protein
MQKALHFDVVLLLKKISKGSTALYGAAESDSGEMELQGEHMKNCSRRVEAVPGVVGWMETGAD